MEEKTVWAGAEQAIAIIKANPPAHALDSTRKHFANAKQKAEAIRVRPYEALVEGAGRAMLADLTAFFDSQPPQVFERYKALQRAQQRGFWRRVEGGQDPLEALDELRAQR